MENMDKEYTVPKWGLIVLPKIRQMPQSLSSQFVCPSPKVLDFNKKRLHWASVVCVGPEKSDDCPSHDPISSLMKITLHEMHDVN
jgi:hypothetical protein